MQKSWVAGVVAFLGMHGHRKSQLQASMYWPLTAHCAIESSSQRCLPMTFAPMPDNVKTHMVSYSSDTWHCRVNCHDWPAANYEDQDAPPLQRSPQSKSAP